MHRALRLLASVAAACIGAAVATAANAQDRPPKLEPLPEAPPPPAVRDGADEPRVTINKPQEGDKVEEIRDGGRIVMLKVTPPGGVPYYLMDPTGDGTWQRNPTDTGFRVPMWTIKQFD